MKVAVKTDICFFLLGLDPILKTKIDLEEDTMVWMIRVGPSWVTKRSG